MWYILTELQEIATRRKSPLLTGKLGGTKKDGRRRKLLKMREASLFFQITYITYQRPLNLSSAATNICRGFEQALEKDAALRKAIKTLEAQI
ncbi:hypothetical protein EG832_06525 [bacterium]|nr:hypothetical protein [bacterium]